MSVVEQVAEQACSWVWLPDELHGDVPGDPPPQPELFELFQEELGVARPERLAGVRPQERVQRRTVEDVVETFVPVPVLDAPVPLLAEQLVDVLALLEKQEKEEEPRMDRLEDMILEGKSVSAAEMVGQGRWDEEKKEEEEEENKLPKTTAVETSLLHAAQVPAVQVREHGGASLPVHRQSVLAFPAVTQMRGTHSAKLCRSPSGFHKCSSWVRLCSLVWCSDRCMVQTVQKTVEFLQVQLLDKVVVESRPSGQFFSPR